MVTRSCSCTAANGVPFAEIFAIVSKWRKWFFEPPPLGGALPAFPLSVFVAAL